jgi:hypothetical protein
MAETAATLDVTRSISTRLTGAWEAYKNRDEAAHSAFLTDDYVAIHADGTRRDGKPTAREIAATPISGYSLQNVQIARIDIRTALVRYLVEVHQPNGQVARSLVGEVWVERGGQWLCRFFQGTLAK